MKLNIMIKPALLSLFLLLISIGAKAQTDLYVVPDGAWIGAHCFSEKKLGFDFKMETNAPLDLIRAEISPRFRLFSNEYGFWYIGLGVSLIPAKIGIEGEGDLVNGVIADLGFRLTPLKLYPNWKILMEISPLVNPDGKGSPILRSRFGIAWTLRSKNK